MIDRFGLDRVVGVHGHRNAVAAGVAPRLCGVVMPQAHLVVPFVSGRVLDAEILAEPGVLTRCINTLSLLHHAEPVEGSFSIFDDARRYLSIANAENLPVPTDLDELVTCLDGVEQIFEHIAAPKLLSHNDLQLQNLIIAPDLVWLLDYEYAAMGNPYLDLAMLLCYGDVVESRRRDALKAYFGKVRHTDSARVQLMYLAATMREAIWSVVAEPVQTETGFDYQGWAQRFFTRARNLVASSGFRQAMQVAQPVADDVAVFAEARHIAEGLAQRGVNPNRSRRSDQRDI
ncbi:hypothetical protein BCA37_25470 [Mycobacterium sp. djl-10]|nr:hypothetical protein BCA37_25470 [Mycobacterium sp. djl-10]